jgi:1-acyl-sn-glycerol-3-phosphate acyltransferase
LFKNLKVVHAEYIPKTGPVIIVANHAAAYDPVCLQVACKDRLIRFMEAREYYDWVLLKPLYRLAGAIPVNRTGNDTAGIRTALRELTQNGCIGVFPEGRISEDGRLHEARQGVALLALLSHAVVVPAYIQGTSPFLGMIRDFLKFDDVTVRFGPPLRFDDLAAGHGHKVIRDAALKRIMEALERLRGQSNSRRAA